MKDVGTDSFAHLKINVRKDGKSMGQNERDFEKIENMKREYDEIQMTEEQVEKMKEQISMAKEEKSMKNRKHMMRNIAVAAAAMAVFILLPNTSGKVAYAMSNIPVLGKLVEVVTFRDYQYESERHNADINVPELVAEGTELVTGTEQSAVADEKTQENLKKTTEEINAEIQKITNEIVAEFEENLADEEGYQDVMVKHEVLNTTADYFTLKLICFQASGSGAEWDYFYTIDLTTGERMALKDLFVEDADYITPISENIKTQMREQMKADDMVYYWVDDEIEEINFKAITDETSFYLNENGEIVIAFDEYEVAPGYMGCVEFVIPDEVTEDIRK